MIELTPAQKLVLAPRMTWMLWGSLQAGIALLIGIAVVDLTVVYGHPFLPPSMRWFADVLAGIAALPVLGGIFVHWRFVRREPDENHRSVRRLRELLAGASASSDPDGDAIAVAVAIAGGFRGASILSWAMGEGGAMLCAISFLLCGFQPAPLAVFALWVVSMQLHAPTRAIGTAYGVARLRLAGLTEEQARTLLARVESIRGNSRTWSQP